MAVDAAMQALIHTGVRFAAVNAGGDLRIHGPLPGHSSWPVRVEAGERDIDVTLHKGALATSSTTKRRWIRGTEQRHHLLDPRTGAPVTNEVLSVTVAASSCTEGEVHAKTVLILGSADGQSYLAERGITSLIVTKDWLIPVCGWPAPDLSTSVAC
jgi:thiamine biosynthesis lipoprotein